MATRKRKEGSLEETKVWANEVFQIRKHSSDGAKSAHEEKNERLGRTSLVLLFVLGVVAGLVNGGILAANAAFCKIQARIIANGGTFSLGLLYFLLIMCTLVFAASCACKYGSRAAAGSGLPEFKYLLGSEMGVAGYEKLISLRILVFKIIGLVFSVGGGLSVGSEGPLVHTAACVAYFLMKNIPEFSEILDSQSITKQIFAASAAVGISSAFNSPVGGLLFSIEVTSTFYLVANYWRSFIAAMAGAVACNLLLITKEGANSDPLLTLQMSDNEKSQYSKWELAVFLAIGLIFGWLAHFYLLIHKKLSAFMKPYNRDYPLVIAVCGAVVTAFVVYLSQQFSKESVGVISIVSDVFNKGKIVEMTNIPFFVDKPMEALLINCALRIFLTLLGTNILVPAGIFMPVVLIGGLLGRFVGHVVSDCGFNCYIPGYAMVGACAFSAGITHTISVSMIIVEMTGDLKMLLPCLVVSVVAAGITKAHGISVYDIGMINKGIQTFQLLLLEKNSPQRHAGTIMDDQAVMVPRVDTILGLIKKLQESPQVTYPLVEELTTKKRSNGARRKVKLVGCYNRRDLFAFLEMLFEQHDLLFVIRTMLPEDAAESERVRQHDAKVLKARTERQRYTRAIADTLLRTPLFSRTPIARKNGRDVQNPLHLESLAAAGSAAGGLVSSSGAPKSKPKPKPKRVKTPHPKAKKSQATEEGYAIVVASDAEGDGEGEGEQVVPSSPSPESLPIPETPFALSPSATVLSTPGTNLVRVDFEEEGEGDVFEKTPVGRGQVDSPGSAKSVGSNDSSYLWNLINHAMVTSADAVRTSFGANPAAASKANGAVAQQDLATFDPAEPKIAALFAKEVVLEEENVAVNYFPFSVHERAPMEQLYVLFEMVKLQTIFIVRDGELCGMISRDRLLESLKRKN